MVWWGDLRRIDQVAHDVLVAIERQRLVMASR